jgi:kinesin family member 18/19
MILSMRDIFEYIQANESTLECRVQLSYLEVYNEEIKDLLIDNNSLVDGGDGRTRIRSAGKRRAPAPLNEQSLALREDPGRGIFVAGLSVHEPTSAVEVFDLLAAGNLRRTQCATDANARSSRSHAVLQVTVSVKNRYVFRFFFSQH